MSTELLSVGQMAERGGVAVSTLHFYERKGLIRSHRSGGNQPATGATPCAGWR